MMKTLLSFLIIAFLMASCGLDANQEKSLNTALIKYLAATNQNMRVSKAAATHPVFLKYYLKKGHAFFKEQFAAQDSTWSDPLVGRIKQSGQVIHVEVKIRLQGKDSYEFAKKRAVIIGVSEDNGKDWFFINGKDYYSKKVCPNFKRLLE